MTEINYGPQIDSSHCKGCGTCYKICPMDVYGWDEEKKRPKVLYPGECYICCFCETMCPEVAIDVLIPLHQMLDFGIAPTELSKKRLFLGEK